jgi:hypothetical protein
MSSSIARDIAARPWNGNVIYGGGDVLFESGRFAVVAQRARNNKELGFGADKYTEMVIVFQAYEGDSCKMFLRPPTVPARLIMRYAKILKAIVLRLDEMDKGGWRFDIINQGGRYYSNPSNARGKLTSKNKSSIEAFNACGDGFAGVYFTTLWLRLFLRKLNKYDSQATSTANFSKNEQQLHKAKKLFQTQAQNQVPKAVLTSLPDLPVEHMVEIITSAQDKIEDGAQIDAAIEAALKEHKRAMKKSQKAQTLTAKG